MFKSDLSNDGKYVLTTLHNYNGKIELISALVNTVSLRTIFDANSMLKLDLKESDFRGKEYRTVNVFNLDGNKINGVKLYCYDLVQLTLGTVDLGKQSILITFDERFNRNILGLDILQQANILQLANTKGKQLLYKL